MIVVEQIRSIEKMDVELGGIFFGATVSTTNDMQHRWQ